MGSLNFQRDINHKIDRLYVHWDVNSLCNYNCSYCYAKNLTYVDDWGSEPSFSTQQLIIHAIRRSTLPVFLGLLGGEPTIDPNYEKLVELSHDAISTHPDGRLYVTTNGSRSIDWWKGHREFQNMYFLWSIHFEHVTNFDAYVDKIKVMIDKGFRNKVNVMLNPDSGTWDDTIKVLDLLKSVDAEVHPHFLYNGGDVHDLYEYSDEFYQRFDFLKDYPKYFEYNIDGKTTIYNDYEVFVNGLTDFKGWTCFNNNYEIDMYGAVNRFCFNEHADLTTDFNYFNHITEITPDICPHVSCNCDALLKIYKEIVS